MEEVYWYLSFVVGSLRIKPLTRSVAANQKKMSHDFAQVMAKVSTLGQDTRKLVDCSDVIPIPKPLRMTKVSAKLPAGYTVDDVEGSVSDSCCVCLTITLSHIYTVP